MVSPCPFRAYSTEPCLRSHAYIRERWGEGERRGEGGRERGEREGGREGGRKRRERRKGEEEGREGGRKGVYVCHSLNM